MRLAIRALGPASLLAVLAVGCASAPASSSGTAISIKDFSFTPAQLSVSKGAAVTWTSSGSTAHTVTSGAPGSPTGKFDQQVDAGKTFIFTFADAGAFAFFCKIHTTMTATVEVR